MEIIGDDNKTSICGIWEQKPRQGAFRIKGKQKRSDNWLFPLPRKFPVERSRELGKCLERKVGSRKRLEILGHIYATA